MAGVQFFHMSYADINREEVTRTIDNNSSVVDYLVNRDPFFNYESSGSDDTDSITFEVDFGTSRTIDTLILVETNLKGFTLDYLTGGGLWSNLITETNNTDETYFGQFTPVSTMGVRLIMNTTMTADAQKTLRDFIITQEIGQLAGYPKLSINRKATAVKKKMINNRDKAVAAMPDISINLGFDNYVGTADRDLVDSIVELTEAFLLWPCGGNNSQFAHADVGYRLKDIYLVELDTNGYNHSFTKNLYQSGMNFTLTFNEAA